MKKGITYYEARVLGNIIGSFKTLTFGAYQKVKKVADCVNEIEKEYSGLITEKLAELKTDSLSSDHPSYNEVANIVNNNAELNTKDLQSYTREELHEQIDGLEFTFSERNLLENYLVKEEEPKKENKK